jgi:hypothetical protein
VVLKFTRDFMVEIGRKGGRKSAAAALKKRRLSEINRAKALKRWHRPNPLCCHQSRRCDSASVDLLSDDTVLQSDESKEAIVSGVGTS